MRPARRENFPDSSNLFIRFLFFLFFLGLIIFGFLVFKESKFGKFDRFNVVLVSSTLTLVSMDIAGHTVTKVVLPADLYISDLAYGYGSYKASSIYSVGELDKRGGETVSASISDYIGIPVDGYVLNLKEILSPSLFTAKSNLNILEKARMVLAMLQTRFDKVGVIDLGKFSEPLVLSDGSTALTLDKDVLDERLRDVFSEKRIRDESLRLEVINSTKVVGLANRAGRILGNIGGDIVSVNSTDLVSNQCQIKVDKKTGNSITVLRIKDLFSCTVEILEDRGRGEIQVILGQNYASKLGK